MNVLQLTLKLMHTMKVNMVPMLVPALVQKKEANATALIILGILNGTKYQTFILFLFRDDTVGSFLKRKNDLAAKI